MEILQGVSHRGTANVEINNRLEAVLCLEISTGLGVQSKAFSHT